MKKNYGTMIINDQAIKDTPIEDVVGHYINLKKSGPRLVGLCPFHNEKTPSFSVTPNLGIFKCFGCGEGGDGVKFVMTHDKTTYPEALRKIAEIGGVSIEEQKQKLSPEQIKKRAKDDLMMDLMRIAVEFYKKPLPKAENKEFVLVAGREIAATVAEAFKVGITPANKEALTKELLFQGNKIEILQKIGLSNRAKMDFFQNRIILPIQDYKGRVVGIAGRELGKGKIKYLNSPASPIFDKSAVLYGLYQSNRLAQERDHIHLVEGQIDVLSMHSEELFDTVGKQGEGLTDQQILHLSLVSNITIMYDGDEAGRKSAIKTIDRLSEESFNLNIVIFPEGEDPDSMIRSLRKKGESFLAWKIKATENAIVWRVMQSIGTNRDPWSIQGAVDLAAKLLYNVESDVVFEHIIGELCKTKNLGSQRRNIAKAIKKAEEVSLSKEGKLVNDLQESDIKEYGIYVDYNKYFKSYNPKMPGTQLSNFAIKTIMQVIGQEQSEIIVEVKNENGKSFTTAVNTDFLISKDKFLSLLIRRGNFLFMPGCKQDDFIRIVRRTIDKIPVCYPLHALGYHTDGFRSWSDGISIGDKFIPVNEYGIVAYKENKYYLPYKSKIDKDIRGNTGLFFHKYFTYNPDASFTLKEWSDLFKIVHGPNGTIGAAWYMSSLFRDIIFGIFNFYPHLNMFGPSGSGKSYFLDSLAAMFGKPQPPLHLENTTIPGFYARLEQQTNAIVGTNEYSNKVKFQIIEGLKDAYDGGGRTKRDLKNLISTNQSQVLSAIMFAGQQRPTQDIALLKRCISLNFSNGSNDAKAKENGQKLKDIEKEGRLAHITVEIDVHRDYIETNFYTEFEKMRRVVTAGLGDFQAEDRILNNHVIPLAVFSLLAQKLDFGWTVQELTESIIKNIIDQSAVIADEDEMAKFWQILEYFMLTMELKANYDYMITTESMVKVSNAEVRKFDKPIDVLYIRMAKAHSMYSSRFRQETGQKAFSKTEVRYYLKQSDAYLGSHKKSFPAGKYNCMIFDISKMPVDLEVNATPPEIINKQIEA